MWVFAIALRLHKKIMLSVKHSRNASMDRNTKSIFVSGVKREVSLTLTQEEMHLFKILQNNIHMTYINGIGEKNDCLK